MIPDRIIKKATEGGWTLTMSHFKLPGSVGPEDFNYLMIALDPTFWQALGKALGWGTTEIEGKEWKTGRDGYLNVWHSYAMDLYDLILTGGATEKFWEELIPSPTD